MKASRRFSSHAYEGQQQVRGSFAQLPERNPKEHTYSSPETRGNSEQVKTKTTAPHPAPCHKLLNYVLFIAPIKLWKNVWLCFYGFFLFRCHLYAHRCCLLRDVGVRVHLWARLTGNELGGARYSSLICQKIWASRVKLKQSLVTATDQEGDQAL